jgi:hypothetical protein
MIEIAAAVSMASSAFSAIKKAMETGQEIEDMMDYFGKWFEAKEHLAEGSVTSNNQPMLKKMFSGKSVEAQALQITHAKHKMKQMEKELYEYLLYTGQKEFYDDMMRERRAIREAKIREAQKRAQRKAFWIDLILGGGALIFACVILFYTVNLIVSAST